MNLSESGNSEFDRLLEEFSRRLEHGEALPLDEINRLDQRQRDELYCLLPAMEMLAALASRDRSGSPPDSHGTIDPPQFPLGDFHIL